MRLFSPDSTHWYTCHGTPLHTVKGANGEYRPTTLRDAKKWRLLPSVTNIIGIIQKEGISQWKMNHCVEAALKVGNHLSHRRLAVLGELREHRLEDGIQVTFGTALPGGEFHAGDYWVFAARTADASVEQLQQAPPRGVHRHFGRLALVTFAPEDVAGLTGVELLERVQRIATEGACVPRALAELDSASVKFPRVVDAGREGVEGAVRGWLE